MRKSLWGNRFSPWDSINSKGSCNDALPTEVLEGLHAAWKENSKSLVVTLDNYESLPWFLRGGRREGPSFLCVRASETQTDTMALKSVATPLPGSGTCLTGIWNTLDVNPSFTTSSSVALNTFPNSINLGAFFCNMRIIIISFGCIQSVQLMIFNSGVGEDTWESLGLQGDPASSS